MAADNHHQPFFSSPTFSLQSLVFSLCIVVFLGGELLHGDVTLPAIFGDHMVLQRGMTLPIWGKAAPGEGVQVQIAGRYAQTTADDRGYWRVTLRPLPASWSPEILIVQGRNHLEVHDVLIGDVWICAGEGNMKFPLSEAAGGEDLSAMPIDRGLRFFRMAQQTASLPDHQGSGEWVICTPETARTFSAVGYFFARDLRSSHQLPMGMIQCTWDETPIQAWVSREGLSSSPAFTKYLASPSSTPELPPQQISSALFNGMISPLVPYAMTGAIWYQGESNEGAGALEYRRLFPRLIRDWRRQWGEGPFPFFFVSPAGYGAEDGPVVESYDGEDHVPGSAWPWLREGAACALTLPNTGMALATDLGLPDERQPPDKLDVGRRLALLARHRVYGEDLVDSGPTYRSSAREGDKIRVTFDHGGGGLTLGASPFQPGDALPSIDPKLKGFALAGSDHKWFPAVGEIQGTSVLLSSDEVPHPESVRYNWRGFPTGNLYNKQGLPAVPFRSDSEQPDSPKK